MQDSGFSDVFYNMPEPLNVPALIFYWCGLGASWLGGWVGGWVGGWLCCALNTHGLIPLCRAAGSMLF